MCAYVIFVLFCVVLCVDIVMVIWTLGFRLMLCIFGMETKYFAKLIA